MNISAPSSSNPSRSATPSVNANSRFTSQNATTEDLLKSQTVGLVQLSDFRKRRAEVIEQKERERQDGKNGLSGKSSATTPQSGEGTPKPPKKKRKNIGKGKLSFGLEDDEDSDSVASLSSRATPRESTPIDKPRKPNADSEGHDTVEEPSTNKPLAPNTKVSFVPKAVSKSALIREAQTREQLRKEYLSIQEAVKATEIAIPFVFYDGTDIPGGICRVKKGDHIWLYLDKARKVGAEKGIKGAGDRSRREWARVGVDDLLLVRGEIIIPHHYDFYYFIVNKTVGFDSALIFPYSTQPTTSTPSSTSIAEGQINAATYEPLSQPGKKKERELNEEELSGLEGTKDDPTLTKVVDRRWYERNKHIFPASVWEEYDPGKEYNKGVRKDGQGNVFFFSR